MKSLYKFTEERIEQMDGKQLYAIHESTHTYDSFREKIAGIITQSTAYQEWETELTGDLDDMELAIRITESLKRGMIQLIKIEFEGMIEDAIYDYLDFQDLREDPCGHFGVSERNIVGV